MDPCLFSGGWQVKLANTQQTAQPCGDYQAWAVTEDEGDWGA